MPREQKTKSKTSQAPSARSKQRTAAIQVPDATRTVADTGSAVPNETPMVSSITTAEATDASNAAISVPEEQTPVQQGEASKQPVVWTGLQPSWPSWPTSKPGPHSTPPILGTRPINKLRSEQSLEVGYNQQTGEPAQQSPLRSLPDERTTGPTSFDQPTAQDVLGKRKHRL